MYKFSLSVVLIYLSSTLLVNLHSQVCSSVTDITDDLFLIKNSGENARLLQDEDGNFSSPGVTFSELFDDMFDRIIPGDWNSDGTDDLFLIKNSGENARLFQGEDGTFSSSGITFSELFDDSLDHIIPGDWNNDNKLDLFLIENSGENARLLQGEDGTFSSSGVTFSELFDDQFDHIIPGDWNGDGLDDLFLIKQSGENARLLQGEDGIFSSSGVTFSELFDDQFDHIIPGDWNGDGLDDLFLIKQSGENARLLQGEDGIFSSSGVTFSELFDDQFDRIIPGDWNGNGLDDLFLIKQSGENARLLQGENGIFSSSGVTFSELFDDQFDHIIPGRWDGCMLVDAVNVWIQSDLQLGRLYPNPSIYREVQVNVNVERSMEMNISIFDPTGRLVEMLSPITLHQGEQTIAVNLPELSTGNYFVKFMTELGFSVQQLAYFER